MLKLQKGEEVLTKQDPAAFGRLCVETKTNPLHGKQYLPAAFGRLCVETKRTHGLLLSPCPAAFGRLCVETVRFCLALSGLHQPPSGGCVLKLFFGRVLQICSIQPPSGGCVLKQSQNGMGERHRKPAAFGRLCVETMPFRAFLNTSIPSRLRAAVC